MIAFFSNKQKSLIVTPYRCGSRHLMRKLDDYDLFFSNLATDYGKKCFDTLRDDIKTKFFIYRDPVDRYLSLYNNFVFKQIPENAGYNIVPKIRSTNFWEEVYDSLSLLENTAYDDDHTIPQYEYFLRMTEDINEYQIIDVNDYAKFIYLTFADKVEKHKKPLDDTKIDYIALTHYNKISQRLEKIYKADYTHLYPLITKL